MNSGGNRNNSRRSFLVAATMMVGAVGTVGVTIPFIQSWNPSAKAQATGAPVKVDLSKMEPGQQIIVEWRGKPIFLVRRTQTMLKNIRFLNSKLRDPQSKKSVQPTYIINESRAKRDEYLIVVGLCTHLGCSPKYMPTVKPMKFDPEWQGGYYCPCHGSKFDLAGRVFKGVPAPTNLEVPPYIFESHTIVIIGKDKENA